MAVIVSKLGVSLPHGPLRCQLTDSPSCHPRSPLSSTLSLSLRLI
jgi:hypothetical protein